jgi:excisionase family DNA binding protein
MPNDISNLLDGVLEPFFKKIIHSELEKYFLKRNDTTTESDEILSVTQVSKLLQVPVSTIYYYTSNGVIPFSKQGKRLRFLKSEIYRWISEGRQKTIAERRMDSNHYISKNK